MNILKPILITCKRLGALLWKRQLDADMAAEMRSHIELQTQENIAAGMSPEEARRSAHRQFGAVEVIKEACRDRRGFAWLEHAIQDVRFGARMLGKNPGFTALAVLTLALGIGANSTIFTLINTLLLHPLPYPEPDRLVQVFYTSHRSKSWPHAVANFVDQREQNTVFEHMAGFTWANFNLADPGEPPESVLGINATAEIFRALGVAPLLGRGFAPDEDQPGRNNVVVLSHSFWTRRFAADTNIVGRTVRLDGEIASVIGVMPAAFEYPLLWGFIDVWRPLAFSPAQRPDRTHNWLNALARLKPGVSLPQAQAAMNSLAARLAVAFPESNAQRGLRVAPLHESIGDEASRRTAWLTLGLTGFVLLIACVNLANLQLARAAARAREMTVRLALGASRSRVLRQLLVESLMLAVIGGGLGLVLAIAGSNFLGDRLTFPGGHRGLAMILDARVLIFVTICSVVTGVLFGLAPAWLASRTNVNELLKSNARSTTAGHAQNRFRHALIVGEVALALTLLTGAGLFIDGLQRFFHRDPGWKIEGLLTGRLSLHSAKFASAEQRRAFVDQLEQRLSALPGVHGAAISSSLPIWRFGYGRGFQIEGRPQQQPGQETLADQEAVTPGYFATMGIQLKRGRFFNSADTATAPEVVVINESMARHFWPNESPIGKRIGGTGNSTPVWQEIVGVVNDVRFPANLVGPETRWQIFRPLAQEPSAYVAVELRTAGPPQNHAAALRRAVAELDPDLPVNELEPARSIVDRLVANFRLVGATLAAFALLGLLLAAVGIYGVISLFVVQRTGEIGIRMALGAQNRDVLSLVLSKGFLLCGLGILIGLLGTVAIASVLRASVPELAAPDPFTIAGVVLALVFAAFLACWIPARRAARIKPMEALRYE